VTPTGAAARSAAAPGGAYMATPEFHGFLQQNCGTD